MPFREGGRENVGDQNVGDGIEMLKSELARYENDNTAVGRATKKRYQSLLDRTMSGEEAVKREALDEINRLFSETYDFKEGKGMDLDSKDAKQGSLSEAERAEVAAKFGSGVHHHGDSKPPAA